VALIKLVTAILLIWFLVLVVIDFVR